MTVVHLVSGLHGGGAEQVILDLCKLSLHDPRVEMKVLLLSNIDDVAWKFREAGIEVVYPMQSYKQLLHLQKSQPNLLLHAHLYYAGVAAAILKLIRPGTRIIFTLHNTRLPGLHKRLMLFLTKSLRNKDIIFPGTTPAWYQRKDAIPIANGIDLSIFRYLNKVKPARFTFLFAGRLEKQKNPLFLVELAATLKGKHSFVIRIAGEGPLRKSLEDKIDEKGLAGYFEMLGFRNDVPDLLASAHCLLLPSLWEGMPLIVLEAAAAGTPVIATPVGNLASIINDSNGYLGKPEDFKAMIRDLMENYPAAILKAGRLKEDARSHFGLHDAYQEHLENYNKMQFLPR